VHGEDVVSLCGVLCSEIPAWAVAVIGDTAVKTFSREIRELRRLTILRDCVAPPHQIMMIHRVITSCKIIAQLCGLYGIVTWRVVEVLCLSPDGIEVDTDLV
jgi:hypothetical protein